MPKPKVGSYIPPNLRSTQPKENKSWAVPDHHQHEKPSDVLDGEVPNKHDRKWGRLRSVAVEMVERYYGLNGREAEGSLIMQEYTTNYKCSELGFWRVVTGHSHDDILSSLRKQIPDYPEITERPEEARRSRPGGKARRERREAVLARQSKSRSPQDCRERSKSLGSSPTKLDWSDVSKVITSRPGGTAKAAW